MKTILNWEKFNEQFYGPRRIEKEDYVEIGPSPTDESSVQVSDKVDYIEANKAECMKYIEMLSKRFPNCNEIRLDLLKNDHDFGEYYEVAAYYGTAEGEDQAYFIQNNQPEKWTDTEVFNFEYEQDNDDEVQDDNYPDIEYED